MIDLPVPIRPSRWAGFYSRTLGGVLSALLASLLTCSTLGVELQPVLCAGGSLANAPGISFQFPNNYEPSIGPSGHVIGVVQLNGEGVTTDNDSAVVLAFPGEEPQIILREGDPVTTGPEGAFFSSAYPYAVFVDGVGSVAIYGELDTGALSKTRAILSGIPSELEVLAYGREPLEEYPTDTVPPVPKELFSIFTLRMNRQGEIAYLGGLDTGKTFDDIIIWKGDPTPGNERLHYPEPGEPLTAFRYINFDKNFWINSGQDILYAGELQTNYSAGITADNNMGAWLRKAGTGAILEVVREGSIAPTLADTTYAFNRGSTWNNETTLTDSGWIAYASNVKGDGVDTTNDFCFFAGKPGDISLIAREGNFAPGTDGVRFKGLFSLEVSDYGLVAFRGQLDRTDPGVTNSNDWGIWVWNDRILKLYLRTGDEVPGFPGQTWMGFQRLAVSPGGRLVFSASVSGLGQTVWATDSTDREPTLIAGPGSPLTMADGSEREVQSADLEETGGELFDADGRFLLSLELLPANELLYCTALGQLAPPEEIFGTISGRVVDDIDSSGDLSPVDPGIPDAEVQLFVADGNGNPIGSVPFATVRTDTHGYYMIRVAPGRYAVMYQSNRDAGKTPSILDVTVVRDQETLDVNFLETVPPLPLGGVALRLLRPDKYDGIDKKKRSPLEPVSSPSQLKNFASHEPGGGLCADGAMPLIIAIEVEAPSANRLLRWECHVVRGGSVRGGIVGHMQFLERETSGWKSATPEPHLITTQSAGDGKGWAFLAISPLSPTDLIFTGTSPEIELELRIFDSESNDRAATLPLKLRRPPVFLIPSDPSEGWGEEFLQALQQSRHPEFIQALSYESLKAVRDDNGVRPFYLQEVLNSLEWDERVQAIREKWAMAYPDVITHGQGGEILMGLSLESERIPELSFRNADNFNQGRFRYAVAISPAWRGNGFVQLYAIEIENRVRNLGSNQYPGLAHIPHTIRKVNALNIDFDRLLARSLIRPGDYYPSYDTLAPIYIVASRIDASQAQFYRQIGFNRTAQDLLTPMGADGVVDVEDAFFGEEGKGRTLLPEFLAHGADASLFGGAARQTHSYAAGEAVINELDWADPSSSLSAVWIQRTRSNNDGGLGTPDSVALTYALSLIDTTDLSGLPAEGINLVVLGRVGGRVHVRIFGNDRKMLVDKTETELIPGEALEYLKTLLDQDPFPVTPKGPSLRSRIIKIVKLVADPSFAEGKAMLAKQLAKAMLRPHLARLVETTVASRSRTVTTSYSVELEEASGEPLSGGPYWFAEVFGPGGVTAEGLTVAPDPGNPARVSVQVAADVIGDVILYASYEANEGIVFATPIRLVSIAPPGTAIESLTLRPQEIVMDIDDAVAPELWVNYADGSSVRRWLTPEEFSVSSSAPAVVDVSSEMRWLARSYGEATITMNYAGLSAKTTLYVLDPYFPRSYAKWKTTVFNTSQLDDPLVSGDTADADGDQLTTFFEYLTGGDPLNPDEFHPPHIEQVDLGDNSRLALVTRISSRIQDKDLVLQRSSNLSNWSSVMQWTDGGAPEVTPEVIEVFDFGDFQEWWIDPGNSTGGEAFFRIIASPAP
jgi:hypothetical protein